MMKFKFNILVFLLLINATQSFTQTNSVGTIANKTSNDYFSLFFPFGNSSVFLIDNCGRIINKWEDTPNIGPGVAAQLSNDGKLYVSKITRPYFNDTIKAGGAGELIEIRDWNNKLEYTFKLNTSKSRLHHDFTIMPNGNILAIAWENFSPSESINNGRKPELVTEGAVWPDYLIEINPVTNNIVWEWHAWDHLVQDFDATKENFGTVNEHPELIDINHFSASGQADWMHSNAIDYNEELDIILLSVAHFNEVWFIDHSTTTGEAKGNIGGKFERGGDLIYRWGNPRAFKNGNESNQKLFFQHDVRWIKEGNYKNSVSVFNNRVNEEYSGALIFKPKLSENKKFFLKENSFNRYLPTDFTLQIFHPEKKELCRSSGLSSFQILDNDNFFIFSGNQGYGFEINKNNEIDWEYILPFRNGIPVSQGESVNGNSAFKMIKYPLTFQGFENKDLSPKTYIEKNPNELLCTTSIDDVIENKKKVNTIVTDRIRFERSFDHNSVATIFDLFGNEVMRVVINEEIDISALNTGFYLLKAENKVYKFFKLE